MSARWFSAERSARITALTAFIWLGGCGSSAPPYVPPPDAASVDTAQADVADSSASDVAAVVDSSPTTDTGSANGANDTGGVAAEDVNAQDVTPDTAQDAQVPPTKTSKGCGLKATHTTGGVQVTIDAGAAGDGKRGFYLVLPKGYDPTKPHRLIIGYPGTNWVGQQIRPYLKLEDGASNEIFAYPDPLKREFKGWGTYGGWLLGPYAQPAHGNQDLVFTEAMLDYLSEKYCLDTERIFATGHSWGGDMAMVVACFLGDRVRAAAPAAANRPYWFEKGGSGLVKCVGDAAVWIFFGQYDEHFSSQKYQGEFGDQCRDFWVKERACAAPLASNELPYDTPGSCVAYKGCSSPVRYCLYDKKTGHQIPSYFSKAVRDWFRSF